MNLNRPLNVSYNSDRSLRLNQTSAPVQVASFDHSNLSRRLHFMPQVF